MSGALGESVTDSPFTVGVLDIQPDNVEGNIVGVKVIVDLLNVRLVIIVPAALMIRYREHLSERGDECQRQLIGDPLVLRFMPCTLIARF